MRSLHCNRCGRVVAEIRDGRVMKGIECTCKSCAEKKKASDQRGSTFDYNDLFKGIFK